MSCQNHLFCFNMIYIKLRNKYVLPFKEYFENLPNMICLLSYILMRRWYNKKKTEEKTPVFPLFLNSKFMLLETTRPCVSTCQ
jgi:uncharacterized membrane protein